MAAVLACGPEAALCGRSAGAAHGLVKYSGAIEVVAPGRRGKARPGLVVRERSQLDPRDRTEVEGIPCTSVARTLLDLAAVVWPDQLIRACERAEEIESFDLGAIRDVVERNRGRRGVRRLRLAADAMRPAEPAARSELERRFLTLCERERLPRPRVNAWIELPEGGFEVDFSWPQARLVVELDGVAYHAGTTAFETDRERDRRLLLAGWRVMRVTWRQLETQRPEVAAALRALLSPAPRASRGRSGSRAARGAGWRQARGGGALASPGP
jgi:very-short-patch-repair endonuclease